MAPSKVDRLGDMNIFFDDKFSMNPKMKDEDFADERTRAFVSSTSYNDELTGHVFNDREKN